ncbi:MAG: histidine phosphatase family protein [Gammaproteobacteria bacterium]|nr:MAG: histidine phosphatase family protein [Gammaproteobacteria bacterium]
MVTDQQYESIELQSRMFHCLWEAAWIASGATEMKLFLVRHAQSLANREAGCWADPPLTALGVRQARCTAAWLSRHEFRPEILQSRSERFAADVVYSSPMRRAIETSAEIVRVLDAPLVVDARLFEVGGMGCGGIGVWGGLPRLEIEKRFKGAGVGFTGGYHQMGWWFSSCPESLDAAFSRISAWLREMKGRHGEDVVLVVGHGALFDLLAAAAFGWKRKIWMSMENAAVARIDYDGNEWKLVFWNQCDHLSGMHSY